jgi:hypothetical protein
VFPPFLLQEQQGSPNRLPTTFTMFDINTIGVKGFGFKPSQNEADAWEVKRHQDAMAMHENADGTFSQRASTKAELGGYRQHWRAGERHL